MKIAFVGDVHLGNHRLHGGELKLGMNERFRAVLEALRRALAWARHQQCTDVVVLGDLFDTPKPLPQQLTAVRDALREFPGDVHLIPGNHDRVSSEPGDHGLGPLHMGEGLWVYDRPEIIGDSTVEVLLCPFDARPVREWLPEALAGARWSQGERIVCGHFGLWERAQASSQPWLTNANDAVEVVEVAKILAAHSVQHLYVGNYHTHFHWTAEGVDLHQVGALVPTGFDNPGFEYGYVEVWPPVPGADAYIPGPRFVVVGSERELEVALERAERYGCALYADWRVSPEEYVATTQLLEGLNSGARVEVHVDRKFSKLRAAQAAGAARSSETLIDAVHQFVEKHPMPPHVDRERVLAHVRRFLRC
jgi:hypothetical protein